MPEIKVVGFIDVEIDGPVMTIVGGSGTVAVTTIDTTGAKLYVYHPQVGWMEHIDATEEKPSGRRNLPS